jgi:hypothetical protein
VTALTGGLLGAAIGGLAAFFLTKTMLKHGDVGVTGAAAGAGFLIGAAIAGPAANAANTAQLPAPPPPR